MGIVSYGCNGIVSLSGVVFSLMGWLDHVNYYYY